MVFGETYSAPEQSVVWDLRQFYVEWTKEYMAQFSKTHFADNYPEMFKTLRRWHTAIWGRAIKEFKKDNNKDETFEELMQEVINLFNKKEYINTYFLRERNAQAVAEFDKSFDSIVVYMVYLMKKNKLFGSDSINRGLT